MRERLIGAAVLVIAAIILIPWLVSRSHPPREQVQSLPLPPLASAQEPAVLTLPPLSAAAPQAKARSRLAEAPAVSSAVHPASAQALAVEVKAQTEPKLESDKLESEPRSETRTTPKSQSAGKVAAEAEPEPVDAQAASKPPLRTAQPTIHKGDWYVQVASFASRDNAERMIAKLSRAGFLVAISAHTVRGKSWYRVRSGGYPAKAMAATLAERIGAASGTQPIVRRAEENGG